MRRSAGSSANRRLHSAYVKAVSCVHGILSVIDLPAPEPAAGQLVVNVASCGICGSDLHAKGHADELSSVTVEMGYRDIMRSDTPVVMGHEFSGEVAERGRKTPKVFKVGTRVVSFPLVRAHGGPALYGVGMSAMEKLRKLPGWQHVYRAADAVGAAGPKRPVIFECVGLPGVLDGIIAAAPLNSRVLVAGVCMGADQLRPAMANGKEVDLRFVFAYTPLEFRDTLYMLADGKLDASALVTGKVGLDGVAAAFDALGDPEVHAKILVDPRSAVTAP